MKKPDYKRPVIVGIFILLGIVMIFLGVFSVGSRQNLFDKKIMVKAIFDDVGGLQLGNNIWLSGVKVGTIKKMTFSGETKVEVSMQIEHTAQSHLYKNAKVKLSTDGFIGNKIVVIHGGNSSAGYIKDGDYLETESSISTDEMLATLQQSNENIRKITDNLRDITVMIIEGQGSIGALVKDKKIYNELLAAVHNFKTTSSKTITAMNDIQAFSSKLASEQGLLHSLITDTSTFENFAQTIDQLKQSSHAITNVVDNLQFTTGKLKDKDNAVGVLLQDPQVANDLKEAMINIRNSSKKLDEDLEALQHSFLLRGYFRKNKKN